MNKLPYHIAYDLENPPSVTELTEAFSKGDIEAKRKALLALIKSIINDPHFPSMIIPIIHYIAPLEDHFIKKLMFIYWETVEKKKQDGSMLTEMLLACNQIRKDLLHSNEYIRGKTLKLVSNMMFKEFLEPLIQAIVDNLTHKHCYVRKNAIICIYSVFINFGIDMVTEVPDKLEVILANETDLSTKRNAFILLFNMDQEKGLKYIKDLIKNEDFLFEIADIFQLAMLDLIRKKGLASTDRREYLNDILLFNNSPYNSVKYELAETILQLSNSPSVIKVCAQNLITLLVKENDNNIKLIIFDKLMKFNRNMIRVLDDHAVDISNQISNQSIEIKKAVLSLIKAIVSSRNYLDILPILLGSLKQNKANMSSRKTIISTLNDIIAAVPESLSHISTFLIEEIIGIDASEENTDSNKIEEDTILMALNIIKKAIVMCTAEREKFIMQLSKYITYIKSMPALKAALWILSEYAAQSQYSEVISSLKFSLMPLPLQNIKKEDVKQSPHQPTDKVRMKTIIKPDGTYGTEIIQIENKPGHKDSIDAQDECSLRKYIRSGYYPLSSLYVLTLVKLLIKVKSNIAIYNQHICDVLLLTLAICKTDISMEMDRVNRDQINMCLKYLISPSDDIEQVILSSTKQTLEDDYKSTLNTKFSSYCRKDDIVQEFDTSMAFRQLTKEPLMDYDVTEEIEEKESIAALESIQWKQLTGYSSPMYVEANIEFTHCSIIIHLLLINLTEKTLQNVLLEMYSQDEVKITEKPSQINIGPKQTVSQRVVLRCNTTEDYSVYGYYSFKATGVSIITLPLASIKLDLMRIEPCKISEAEYKKQWIDLAWENKICHVYSYIKPYDFYKEFVKSQGFYTVSSVTELDMKCSIFGVNLYGKTKFGTLLHR